MDKPQHLLTGREFQLEAMHALLDLAHQCKRTPHAFDSYLKGKALMLLFEKPSLRTRCSFIRAMQLLGGGVIESVSSTRKQETPADLARVLSGYGDAVMLRTHEDKVLEEMASVSRIPIINGLSALHHPCQILADLGTLQAVFGTLKGLTLSYIGDGNNVLNSLILLAPQMGIALRYCCPKTRMPDPSVLALASGQISAVDTPEEAVRNAHAVYTDVWHSMGCESVSETLFEGFQVNEALMSLADKHAIFMHCMPMMRGKEVSQTLPDQACSQIFLQSEYRLYAQMALLMMLIK